MAIYQAALCATCRTGRSENEARKVWGVPRDGEMDEPESMADRLAGRAARQPHLVVNANLQRWTAGPRQTEDHPELEGMFVRGLERHQVIWAGTGPAAERAQERHLEAPQ